MTAALAALPLSVAALWAGAFLYTRWLERRFPPVGALVDIGSGRIHCVERPANGQNARTVVLVHGASGNFADPHAALAERLSGLGYRVICVDRPGLGWSDRQAPRTLATAPDRQAQWIVEALKRLGVEEAFVAVHSLAGALGLAMAADAPNFVRGLVLLSPASHPWPGGVVWYNRLATTPVAGALFRWLVVPWAVRLSVPGGLRSVFFPYQTPRDYAERTRLLLMARPSQFLANAEDICDFKAHVTRLLAHYRRIRAPIAIVTGDEDQVVYADIHSFGCLRDVPGATMRFVRGLGHSPHWSRPDVVISALEEVEARANAALIKTERGVAV